LQGAILAWVNKARAEDGAERTIPKKQAAALELIREVLVGLARGFGIQ
jgi:hypothetical protein